MSKPLSEMTLQELWTLFPIILTAPDARWPLWYQEEERLLQSVLPGEYALRIRHIGSTAIRGIWAKPIVDILVEAAPGADLSAADEALARAGYRCMSTGDSRRSYNKGYTEEGFAEKVFHLHLTHLGEQKEVVFRDYLNAHPVEAKAYEALKLSLWRPFEHDRDGYTSAKTGFVEEILQRAKEENTAMDR
ncbi:MAG: GrpB family protein [Clostridia bacterium]|nr:GrpB family protein [Clostridia bacterium]